MNNLSYSNIFFLGIGGIGMSALARYFKLTGKNIAGYDKYETELTKQLVQEGIEITYSEKIESISSIYTSVQNTLVVYTPAVPANQEQLIYFIKKGFTVIKRAQLLGNVTLQTPTLAVCGTHGKTTTSTLLAHLFKNSNKNISAFLGGISQNYQSNLLLGNPQSSNHLIITEADEYDRSFLTLHPQTIICTSLDADHLDIYGTVEEMRSSYNDFFSQLKPNGNLIFNHSLTINKLLNKSYYSYSLSNTSASAYTTHLQLKEEGYIFNLVTPFGKIKDIHFYYPGLHNIENAVAASLAGLLNGLSFDEIKAGLETFKGVKRRFEIHLKTNHHLLIDDYAHHPTELITFINSVKKFYPQKKITGIFQPHLYSRTRDFANEFSEALSLLDTAYLLEIYPAREKPIPGITSQWLAEKIKNNLVKVVTPKQLIEDVKTTQPELLLTIGAGDINQLIPQLKEVLND